MKLRKIIVLLFLSAPLAQSVLSAAEYVSAEGLVYDLNEGTRLATFKSLSPELKETLVDLVIPASVEVSGIAYEVAYLGENCCYRNGILKSVEIGENVRTIGATAFSNCTSLERVVFPERLRNIGKMSFYSCSKLSELNLPSGLTEIGDFAFFYMPVLKRAFVPQNVERMGASPFGDCPALEAIEVDPANEFFTSLDGVLYSKDMSRLVNYPIGDGKESFTVPASVTVIGTNSMRNNTVMKSITLDPALQAIEEGAFNYCVLETVHLPANVSMIGSQAFSGNPNLSAFTVDPTNRYFAAQDGMLFTKDKKMLLVGVSQTDIVIPEGVEEICEGAFYRLPKVETLTLSSTVKTIGRSAFSTCSNLSKIEFSTSLETIGLQAFYQCKSIKTLKLPSSLRFIDEAAFAVCSGLHRLEIEEGLQSVATSVFQACTALKKATLPSTLTEVGPAMFYGCLALQECVMPEGIESLGSSAFSSCQKLQSVSFPSTLEYIDNYAFNGSALNSIELPEGLYYIGEGAFEFCNFPECQLPSTVVEIGSNSFSWNPALKSFRSGSSLRQIGAYALAKCDAMTELKLNEGLLSIGACALQACEILPELQLPSTLESVGSYLLIDTPALRALTVLAPEPPDTDGSFYSENYDGYPIVKLLVPFESIDKYKSAPVWQDFASIDGTNSGVVNAFEATPHVVEIYDANGLHVHAPVTGVNFLRMSDGSVKKIMK